MRIIVDTNIVFSAILKTDSLIAKILLTPKTGLDFYTTDLLQSEISEHRQKLKNISGLTSRELDKSISIIVKRIRFIDARFIPVDIFKRVESLLEDIDPDDVEFVALTEHLQGMLWSGDKTLKQGLKSKNWDQFITIDELNRILTGKK